jgi:hypothetical protein
MSVNFRSALRYLLVTTMLTFAGLSSKAYSILAHEAIIDASWKSTLMPLLKQKYPDATREQMLMAHSYAYGGAIMADMGYMPFGNGFSPIWCIMYAAAILCRPLLPIRKI